jgi:hypothetical protein
MRRTSHQPRYHILRMSVTVYSRRHSLSGHTLVLNAIYRHIVSLRQLGLVSPIERRRLEHTPRSMALSAACEDTELWWQDDGRAAYAPDQEGSSVRPSPIVELGSEATLGSIGRRRLSQRRNSA